MALREFRDANGVEWRVWDITPEDAAEGAQSAAFVGDFGRGWLCFESSVGRRRLPNFPTDWASRPDHALAELLSEARPTALHESDETDSGVHRRFEERRRRDSAWREGLPRRRATDPPPYDPRGGPDTGGPQRD